MGMRNLSFSMFWLFSLLTFIVPIATVLYWIFFEDLHRLGFQVVPFTLDTMTINFKSRTLGCLIGFIPVSMVCYGFHQLAKLFKNYAKGQIFSAFNVSLYKKLGATLFAYAFADNLFDMLISWAVSFQNPPGKTYFFTGVNSTQLICLLMGFVVLMIAKVMQEAYRLEQEVELTV